jgi:prevent-host-death family protein
MSELVDTWQIKDARAHLSELVAKAESDGPQVITRNGKRVAVVVSAREWERRSRRRGNLVEFFARSPLRGEGVEITRIRDYPPEIKL